MAGQRFGEQLRSRREYLRLTQEELAQRAALGVRTIRDLEAGRVQRPRGHSVRLLADALGLADDARAAFVSLAYDASESSEEHDGSCCGPDRLPIDVAGFVAYMDGPKALMNSVDRNGGSGSFGTGMLVIVLTPCRAQPMDRTPPCSEEPERHRVSAWGSLCQPEAP